MTLFGTLLQTKCLNAHHFHIFNIDRLQTLNVNMCVRYVVEIIMLFA